MFISASVFYRWDTDATRPFYTTMRSRNREIDLLTYLQTQTSDVACPVGNAEQYIVLVLVADRRQVGDGSRQVAALLAAQHSAELDDAFQRLVVNFTRTHIIHTRRSAAETRRNGNNWHTGVKVKQMIYIAVLCNS